MKYLILPDISGTPIAAEAGESWTVTTEATLGGVFYDHLRTAEGETVGVRYWVMDGVPFHRHAVFGHFLNDDRFEFHQPHGHVDIVFAYKHANALKRGLLEPGGEQEFGGDEVVKRGDALGIAFDLW